MDLTSKAALIVRATNVLGQGVAQAIAEAGADVAASHHGQAAQADELVARLRELGRRVAGQAAPGVEIELTQRGVRYRIRKYYLAGSERIYTLNIHAPKEHFPELETTFVLTLDTLTLVTL